MSEISPFGYIYGKDPKAHHPFWGGGGDIEEYVKSLNGTVEEVENGKLYTIEATDGDDIVSKVIEILVPDAQEIGTYAENVTVTSQHANAQTTYTIKYTTSDDVEHTAGTVIVPDTPIIPDIPTDYVTSVIISHTSTATSDTYSFKYITKDGIEHAMGSVYVSKDYVNSVSVSQSTADGVKTVTITVDNTTYNFDVPVAYLKSIVQSAGQVDDDVYTFTDESGHTISIASPGEYAQYISSVAGGNVAVLNVRKVVNGVASTGSVGTIRLITSDTNPNYHKIEVEDSSGNIISDSWEVGGASVIGSKFGYILGYGTFRLLNALPANYESMMIKTKANTSTNTVNIYCNTVFNRHNAQNLIYIPCVCQTSVSSTAFDKKAGYTNDNITVTLRLEFDLAINWPSTESSPLNVGYANKAKIYVDVNNSTQSIKESFVVCLDNLSLTQNNFQVGTFG